MRLTSDIIAKTYGIPLRKNVDPKTNLNWDGKHINAKGMSEDGILHEIGHWIVAEPLRRKYPDYLLGPGPNESGTLYSTTVKALTDLPQIRGKQYGREETEACIMEFIFGALMGMNTRKYMEDRFFITNMGRWENNTGSDAQDFMEQIESFQKRKILNKAWVPVQLKKIVEKDNLKMLGDYRRFVPTIPG